MIRNSGAFSLLGMSKSRACTFGAVLLIWLCCSSLLVAAQEGITDPVEVKALQDIRNSLIDINKNLSNWRRGDPCTSNWTGVLCFNTTKEDAYLHVRELQLLNMNLSGTLSPSLGHLSYMEILLLNGNQLTGPLPEELGHLPKLDRIQIDQNHISGPIPKSFAYLNSTKHFHMNNNSISGQIPAELSRLPNLVHFLLDNNNLSGTLPPDLYKLPKLLILDLSFNQLAGPIPPNKLSENITTIDLSNNTLNGTIPAYFSDLPRLQLLSIANNSLSGSVPSTIWQTRTNGNEGLDLHFENNRLSNISGSTSLPQNVTLWLQGNPACSNSNIVKFCGSQNVDMNDQSTTESNVTCPTQSCPPPYEYFQTSPISCFCAAPLIFRYRLKSPGFANFIPYRVTFQDYLTSGLELHLYQLDLSSAIWEEGPRLKMQLKLFPVSVNENSSHTFNDSEVRRIISMFTGWNIPDSPLFGPYELLGINLLSPYTNVLFVTPQKSKISKGALVGIVLGAIAGAVTLSAVVSLLIVRKHSRDNRAISKRRRGALSCLLNLRYLVESTIPVFSLTNIKLHASDHREANSRKIPICDIIWEKVNIAYQTGMIFSIVDGRMGSYPSDCVDKFLTLAMKCCNDETDERPSMIDVVRELENMWHMMPESDTKTTDTMSTDTGMEMTSPSSCSLLKNPYVSSEVSSSDLVSGVVPTITPR
ncbi:hypothetical protein Peur_028670 [Populus x canadensis]